MDELRKEVKELLSEVDKTHRYSMSKITELHNRVFELNDVAKPIASRLIRQVQNMRAWYEKRDIPHKTL